MPRMRFVPGLILGLLLGFFLGAAAATFILPPRTVGGGVTALQLQQLTEKLQTVEQDRASLRQQVDQFRDLADRMTASFNDLERRFKTLEDEMRARQEQPSPPNEPLQGVPPPGNPP